MRSSRSSRTPLHSAAFEAIGTSWQIDTGEVLPTTVLHAVHRRCERFDRDWSRFRDDSLVHRMSQHPGSWRLPDDAPALLDLYRELYDATGGAVSPLVGRALEQLGYDATYSLRPSGPVRPVPRWEDAMAWDGEVLTTVAPVVLDIGAAGKGRLVDLVAAVLVAAGIRSFTIDASGDILHRGGAPLRVALEHPLDTTRAIGVAMVGDEAICASASNRRAWPGGHHIVDALTGVPTRRVIATWAVAVDTATADGLSTALFFAEPSALEARFDFEWVRMLEDQTVESSAGFEGELFS